MKCSSYLNFIYKKNRNEKVRNINLIILYTLLFAFLYICLLMIFSLNNTVYKTVSSNLEGENFNITYHRYSGSYFGNELYESVIDKTNDINIISVYSSSNNSNEFIRDFNYLSNEFVIVGDLKEEEKGVLLSQVYKSDYSVGDPFEVSYGEAKVCGFFESSESSYIIDIKYLVNNVEKSINQINIVINNNNLNKSSLNKIIKTYENILRDVSVMDHCSEYNLDIIINTFSKIKIYMIVGIIFTILISIIFVSTLFNTFSINVSEDSYFYAMLRVCGSSKKDLSMINLLENFIIIITSFVISIGLFFALYASLNKFFTKFVSLLFWAVLDDFSYEINVSFIPTFYIFLVPLLLSIIISTLNLIIKRRSSNIFNDSYLSDLNENEK